MLDHMPTFREIYGHFFDLAPGMVGLEDYESLFTHRRNKKIVAEKFLVRHLLAIRHTLKLQASDSVYWIPGLGNPADGLTKTRSDMAPLSRPLESGAYNP